MYFSAIWEDENRNEYIIQFQHGDTEAEARANASTLTAQELGRRACLSLTNRVFDFRDTNGYALTVINGVELALIGGQQLHYMTIQQTKHILALDA